MYVVRYISILVPVTPQRNITQADEIAEAIELLVENGYVVFRGKPGGQRRNGKNKPIVVK